MGEKKVKGWTCVKPESEKVEKLCLPSTRNELIPGYNFKTSTNIGLQHLLPPRDYFEVKPLPKSISKDIKDYKYLQRHYKTTSQEYDCKNAYNDPINQANRIGGTNCFFIKEFEEHIRKREADKISEPQSRYRRDYRAYKFNPDISGTTVDLSPNMYCKIKGIAKNEQPKVDLTSPTLVGHLDNYLSTSKSDYTYISPERRDFFIARKERFAVKKEKDTSRIFEEGLFRFRHLNRTVPKFVPRVPHSGLITESKKEFRDMWGEIYKRPSPVYDDTVQIKITKGDAMKIPAMYQTEYSHYGSKVSPNEIV